MASEDWKKASKSGKGRRTGVLRAKAREGPDGENNEVFKVFEADIHY